MTAALSGIGRVRRSRSGRQQAALKVHSSMMRDVAGLRWQSQCRRRRPSGQRRPSTKPSRGRARVTHTAPRQPSLPSAEAGRATGGGRSTDGADAAECFSTSRNVLCTYTVRMSRDVSPSSNHPFNCLLYHHRSACMRPSCVRTRDAVYVVLSTHIDCR